MGFDLLKFTESLKEAQDDSAAINDSLEKAYNDSVLNEIKLNNLKPSIDKDLFSGDEQSLLGLYQTGIDIREGVLEKAELYEKSLEEFKLSKADYDKDMKTIEDYQSKQDKLLPILNNLRDRAYPDAASKIFGARNKTNEQQYLRVRNEYNQLGLDIKDLSSKWSSLTSESVSNPTAYQQTEMQEKLYIPLSKLKKVKESITEDIEAYKSLTGKGAVFDEDSESVQLSKIPEIKTIDTDYDIDHLVQILDQMPILGRATEGRSWFGGDPTYMLPYTPAPLTVDPETWIHGKPKEEGK